MENNKKLKSSRNLFSRKTQTSSSTNKHQKHKALKNGLIRLDFKLDPKLKAELREKAGREGVSLSTYASKLLEEQVKQPIFMEQHDRNIKTRD